MRTALTDIIVQAVGTAVGGLFTAAAAFLLAGWVGLIHVNGLVSGLLLVLVVGCATMAIYTTTVVLRTPRRVQEYQEVKTELVTRQLKGKIDRGDELTPEEREVWRWLPYK